MLLGVDVGSFPVLMASFPAACPMVLATLTSALSSFSGSALGLLGAAAGFFYPEICKQVTAPS